MLRQLELKADTGVAAVFPGDVHARLIGNGFADNDAIAQHLDGKMAFEFAGLVMLTDRPSPNAVAVQSVHDTIYGGHRFSGELELALCATVPVFEGQRPAVIEQDGKRVRKPIKEPAGNGEFKTTSLFRQAQGHQRVVLLITDGNTRGVTINEQAQ